MKGPIQRSTLRAHLWALTGNEALLDQHRVTFTAEELRSHFPGGAAQCPGLPVSYDHELYVLAGDDDLSPVS